MMHDVYKDKPLECSMFLQVARTEVKTVHGLTESENNGVVQLCYN